MDADVLFGLLRSALMGGSVEVPEGADWVRLFSVLQQNHVAALASEAIGRMPEELRPPREVRIPWFSEREKAAGWFRHQLEVQQEIEGVMGQHGIEMLVLKGTRLARLYPKPELREFGDLDLYFYNRHREADQIAERCLGVKVGDDSHHHTKYDYRGVTVESHYDFVNTHYPRSNSRYEQLLKQLAPSAEFEILFLLRHMAGHFAASRITLRDLVDWHLVATAYRDAADWDMVGQTVEMYGMRGFVETLSAIVANRFSTDTPLRCGGDRELIARMEGDTVYGSYAEHHEENIHRLLWKLRRYRGNRWKQRMTYGNEGSWGLFRSSLASHAKKPRSILHKM